MTISDNSIIITMILIIKGWYSLQRDKICNDYDDVEYNHMVIIKCFSHVVSFITIGSSISYVI